MGLTKKQKSVLKQLNYDLFGPEPSAGIIPPDDISIANDSEIESPSESKTKMAAPQLPTEEELYRLFDVFNMVHFNGKLPSVKIKYSNRMLMAGSYTPVGRLIKIGRKYHEIFPDEIEDTLLHEMIHIIHPNHSRAFKTIAGRLGVSLKAKEHPDLRAAYRYLYICPNCGKEYPRRKRFRMASCGICSKGHRFDPRYKLILKESRK